MQNQLRETGSFLAGPLRTRAECVASMGEDVTAGFTCGFGHARSWRVPPNWSAIDWFEELRAVAITSAWQAKQEYDPLRGVPLAGFVCCRVKARALTRYRQEWRYALRTVPPGTEVTTFSDAIPAARSDRAAFEVLHQALEYLTEPECWLLDQLFWQHRTETVIAAELKISQPAVNKRKRAALVHLRDLL